MSALLRLGTRGSALALAQARAAAALLEAAQPGLKVALVEVQTSGDRLAQASLAAAGGMGLFTKELEEALLSKRVDAAVHSLKDLPTRLAPGLRLAAVSARADFRDAWISPKGLSWKQLAAGAKVGTGSPRRRAQILALRPDIEVVALRGNVDTRLKKIASGMPEAGILAAAGLQRLGRLSEAHSFFSAEEMLPAPGQGFLGLEVREGDAASAAFLLPIHDPRAAAEASAERAFLEALGAGCQAPVAAFARAEGAKLFLRGLVADPKGPGLLRGEETGPVERAAEMGKALAVRLMEQGARSWVTG